MMSPNEYFDEIIVLYIPRRANRYLELRQRLIRENIYVKTFTGCDKNDVQGEYDKFYQKHPWEWTIGNYAIMNSYHKLFKHILHETDYKRVLILEDDILFHKNFNELFSNSIYEIPDDWKLWYLGYVRWDDSPLIKIENKNLFVRPNNMTGNFAVAYDREIIEQTLGALEMGRKIGIQTTDQIIKKTWHNRPTTIVSDPMLISHNYGWSDTAEKVFDNTNWGRHQKGLGRWLNEELYH